MNKLKKTLAILALGAVAVSGAAFAACSDGGDDTEGGHTHNYTEWKYNDTQHWKICEEDGAEGPKSNHNLVDGKCECGYAEEEEEGMLSPVGDTDWYDFTGEDYGKEDWAGKTIAYQFTGVGNVGAGADSGDGINYPTVMNLYTDGSVRILHATVMSGTTTAAAMDTYYGLWENTDGTVSISINYVYAYNTEAQLQYFDRSLYVDGLAFENGEIVISLDLDVYVAANYTSAHELTCDGTIKYATDEAFNQSFDSLE